MVAAADGIAGAGGPETPTGSLPPAVARIAMLMRGYRGMRGLTR